MSYLQRINEQVHVQPSNSSEVLTFRDRESLRRFTSAIGRNEYAPALKFGAKLQTLYLDNVALTPDIVTQIFIRSFHPILDYPGCQYETLYNRALAALKVWWIYGDKLPLDNENETK
jgi:hypothetical protein